MRTFKDEKQSKGGKVNHPKFELLAYGILLSIGMAVLLLTMASSSGEALNLIKPIIPFMPLAAILTICIDVTLVTVFLFTIKGNDSNK